MTTILNSTDKNHWIIAESSVGLHYTRIFWKEVVISHNLFPLDAIGIPIKKRCLPFERNKTGIHSTRHKREPRCPPLFKSSFYTTFYKTPILVLVFGNWMKSKEEFCFNQKRLKVRIEFRVGCFEVSSPRGSMRDTTQLFQEPHSASQHQATIALNYLHEHLCFILTYLVHPLSRCVLR